MTLSLSLFTALALSASFTITIPVSTPVSTPASDLAAASTRPLSPAAAPSGDIIKSTVTHPSKPLAAEMFLTAQTQHRFLKVSQALSTLSRLQELLLAQLSSTASRMLLAKAFRLRGRIALYQKSPKEARLAFVSAYFLDPHFFPKTADWPPKERLSYADSIAHCTHSASGMLSIQVTPSYAQVWLDGTLRGQGSMTLSSLLPGDHLVEVNAAQHQSISALVTLTGNKQLNNTSFFLIPKSSQKRPLLKLSPATSQQSQSPQTTLSTFPATQQHSPPPSWYKPWMGWSLAAAALGVTSGLTYQQYALQQKRVTLVLGQP